MNFHAATPDVSTEAVAPRKVRGRLFRKYVALFVAVVCIALVANGIFDIWFTYQDFRALLVRIQREQADAAAGKISQFVKEIEGQMGWATQLPWNASTVDEWRFDAVRLLRQVPAITELTQLDASGREQARMSRLAMDVVGSQADFSQHPKFVEAMANKVYYGPVYFHRESEPYMTLAMAGARRDYGVIAAEVNLKFIWDVVSQIKVGTGGQAYVVDAEGRLIAHPDINLVLRNTDLSEFSQVKAARSTKPPSPGQEPVAEDILGRKVLTAHARVASLGWFVFVELPIEEAYAPLYGSIERSGLLLLAALALAFGSGLFLARRMIVPIQALRTGAARIGSGDLSQRISIKTDDELEALGEQFNSMAAQLQNSYATLERKVEERTHQLEVANLAKSRFLAAASHDLRQPLHALGLFVAQLKARMDAAERGRIIDRINAAVAAMNDLFNALLDISKLDAGVLTPNVTEFPIAQVLKRIETTFAHAARENGLSLRVLSSSAYVRSDAILLERILLNLVSNAVRYTNHGGVVVGCRHRGDRMRIEVWDTGIGIPENQRANIFGEFYRLAGSAQGGLGLGLSIVDRLCSLLDHPVELTSTFGKGSRFAVSVPSAKAPAKAAETLAPAQPSIDVLQGKLVVVIDDDQLVLEGMGGLLRAWGCTVVSGESDSTVMPELAQHPREPDLIICDYRLRNGGTGIQAIERLRTSFGTPVPAFLISGDTAPERLRDARGSGYHLLHKPVLPMALRAILTQLLKKDQVAGAA